MQRSLQDIMADESIEDKSAAARATLRAFDRFQDAEYNTAVARARTAKQFETFMDPDNVRLFPNLRWLASRSANPRAKHIPFYNMVIPKVDKEKAILQFWQGCTPGTEWNCKCDLEETDDPPTHGWKETVKDAPVAPRGLEGNPAQTGVVFTNNASYINATKGKFLDEEGNDRVILESCRFTRQQLNKDPGFKSYLKELKSEPAKCCIKGKEYDVFFIKEGLKDPVQKGVSSDFYFYQIELLKNIRKLLPKAKCVDKKRADSSHNIGAVKEIKDKSDFFFYMEFVIERDFAGEAIRKAYFNIGRFKESQQLYFWDITEKIFE